MSLTIQRRIAVLRETAQRYRNYSGRMLMNASDEGDEDDARQYAQLAQEAAREADRLEDTQGSEK